MRNEGIAKTYYAGAAVSAHRIVKHGADETLAVQAAAATDKLMGVSDLGADASGESMDVIKSGIALVVYGGTVAAGDLLTSDADGKAVVANPAATVSNRIIGVAEVAGVSGDIGSVCIQFGSVTNGANS
jgi:hypothetical protein